MSQQLHYAEICEAVRELVQGGVALTADAGGRDTVSVGSNRLFAVGQAVVLEDLDGATEAHTVAELVGLTQLRLAREVEAEFRVSRGSRLRWATVPLPGLKWIGQGRPELIPQPPETQLPAVILAPGRMEQPLGAGTNATRRQDYRLSVYYLERPAPGQVSGVEILGKADALFGVLGSDPYLGGAAWYAQVVRVDPDPEAVRKLRAAGREVVGVEVELMVQRME